MGVGINWHGAPKLADRDTSSVLDLLQTAHKAMPDSEWACAQFLLAIKSAWDRVQRGESVSPTEFQRYDLLQGRTVNTVALGTNRSLSGIACGINAAGALGIQVIAPDSKPSNGIASTARTHWVNSGEVRVSVNPSVSP